jgi:hypothetical protein
LKEIFIYILLPAIILIFFADSSFGKSEEISLDDKLSEALIKTHFNDAEDYFARNFISINPEEDFAELAMIHANIVLNTLKKSDKPAIVGLALSGPLIDRFTQLLNTGRAPVEKTKLSKLVTVAGKTIEYEITVRTNSSVVLLGTSTEGDEIYSKIKITSFDPLKIIVKTDVTIEGKSTNFKLIATGNGSGTALVSMFKFETETSRFYFKAIQDQAKPIFALALSMTSNSSEQTLSDIFKHFWQ